MSGWATKILQIKKGPPLAERPAYPAVISGAGGQGQADWRNRFPADTYVQGFLKHIALGAADPAFQEVQVLSELKAIHAELRDAITGLEAIVSRAEPDENPWRPPASG